MPQSDSIKLLSAALVKAQAEFSSVPKNESNPYFNSKFSSLAETVKTASPVLAKYGLAVAQFPGVGDDDVLITYLLHESGEYITHEARLHLAKVDPQAHGSAITYMRRYAYSSVLGLVNEADDDGNAASHAPSQPALGAHRRSAPKVPTSPTPSTSSTPSNVPDRVGAADAKRELIADATSKGWDKQMATELAKKAWGERGAHPVERGELSLLAMSIERVPDAT